jgi:predicted metal-binding protein
MSYVVLQRHDVLTTRRKLTCILTCFSCSAVSVRRQSSVTARRTRNSAKHLASCKPIQPVQPSIAMTTIEAISQRHE